jgi:predicted PhzF superfamily epimerase YddE/YHI9
MKTPRELLLQRHQGANVRLDRIREDVVSQLTKTTASLEQGASTNTLLKLWRELIWPKPIAWTGVAAAWGLILLLKLSTQDASHVVAQKSSTSPEAIAEVRQQKRFFAELVGIAERPAAASASPVLPRPRSERRPKLPMG